MMDIKDIQEEAYKRGLEAGRREVVEERFPMLKGINLGEGVTAEQVVSDLLKCVNEESHCDSCHTCGRGCVGALMRDAAAVIEALLCGAESEVPAHGTSRMPSPTSAEDTNVPCNGDWIPVTEQLPNTDKRVLVCCRTKRGLQNINMAYLFSGHWHGQGSMSGVTHWMPLSDPPKEDK